MTPEDRAAVLLITEDVAGVRRAPGVPEITCVWCECVIAKGESFFVERDLPDSPFSHLHDTACRDAVDSFNRHVKYADSPDGLKQYPMPGKREWSRSRVKALIGNIEGITRDDG